MKNEFYKTTVVIFAYNRLENLRSLWDSLLNCEGIGNRSIVIFHDGLKDNASDEDRKKWENVKDWLTNLSGNVSIEVRFSVTNQGLAKSVHNGVSQILKTEEQVIVLEDDLLLANGFLNFMDEALQVYKDSENIFSISGYSRLNKTDSYQGKDVFLFPRPSSWGWGTWSNRWEPFELNKFDRSELANYQRLKLFQKGGVDLTWMLRNQVLGKIDSWAIQWSWYQFINDAYSIYPICSKVQNIGSGPDATHTAKLHGLEGEICEDKLYLPADLVVDQKMISDYGKLYRIGYFSWFKNLLFLTRLRFGIG